MSWYENSRLPGESKSSIGGWDKLHDQARRNWTRSPDDRRSDPVQVKHGTNVADRLADEIADCPLMYGESALDDELNTSAEAPTPSRAR